jgi:hypothetical protein
MSAPAPRRPRLIALPLLAALATPAAARAQDACDCVAAQCERFEPASAVLTGTLRQATAPRVTHYGAHRNERFERYFVLELARPLCVRGIAGDALNDRTRDGVTRVELVLDAPEWRALHGRVGARVVLRGTLFTAHTAHHHTDVLLTVREVLRAPR